MSILHESTPSVRDFRAGLALLPGGVSVITTTGEGGPAGFTASAVCSVTDSPPTVLVCMNRGSHAYPRFTRNRVLCVNVLSGEQQHLSRLFSDRDVPMPQRFVQCDWSTLATGSPALAGALVHLDGDITAAHDVGTHSIFVVQLRGVAVSSQAEQTPGLAYFNRDYHVLQCAPKAAALAA